MLIIGLTFTIIRYQYRLPFDPAPMFDYGAYLLLALTMILSLVFKRSKIFFISVVLLIALLFFAWQASVASVTRSEFEIIALVYGLVIPINFAIILAYQERQLLSVYGASRFALILAQGVIFTYLYLSPQAWLASAIRFEIFPTASLTWASAFLEIAPQPILLGWLLTCVTILIVAYINRATAQYGMLGSYLAYVIAIPMSLVPHGFEMFVAAAALLLFVTTLSDSYNMVFQDELTGLPGRRALNQHMSSLGNRYVLAMLDVDHFKKFNDQHGHDVGDQVLQMVARQIGNVKGGGKAYRYGGEEFSVVFSSKQKDEAFYYLDDVRKSIQNYEMVIRDDEARPEIPSDETTRLRSRGSYRHATKKVSVTISIGVADKSDRAETAEQVLRKADQALYRAKQAGRNQVAD